MMTPRTLPKFDNARMGQREPEFLAWVAICLAMDVHSYVELGTGHSHYMHTAGISRVVAVDINNPPYDGMSNEGVNYVQGSSYDSATLAQVLGIVGDQPDVVFIDADHDGDAPQRDFDLWYPQARKLIGFHDICIPNVARIWNDLSLKHPSVEFLGRDLASAIAWQGPGTPSNGRMSAGGIGVIFKLT